MAMQMQALLGGPACHLANGSRMTRMIFPLGSVSSLGRQSLRVNCVAKEAEQDGVDDQSKSTSTSPKSSATESKSTTASISSKSGPTDSGKKGNTSWTDLLAFSGPAPERINGRLAMVGLMTALGVELSKGRGLFAQISDGGALWFLGTSIVLSIASLVPLLKGDNPEEDDDGWFNSDAELWNGRLAMLGLLALGLIEYVKGGALI